MLDWSWFLVGLLLAICLFLAFGWWSSRKDLDSRQRVAGEQLAEMTRLRGANATLQLKVSALSTSDPRRINVAELVPGMCSAKPTDSTAGFVRLAFRAHIAWFNDCPAVLHVREVISAPMDDAVRHTMACELYARAILESALAAHLDGENPRTDRHVYSQLHDSLGAQFAREMRVAVMERGVVFDDAPPAPAAAPTT